MSQDLLIFLIQMGFDSGLLNVSFLAIFKS